MSMSRTQTRGEPPTSAAAECRDGSALSDDIRAGAEYLVTGSEQRE